MGIKLKHKDDNKQTAVVRDEVQAAAFLKAGFVPATKVDEEKLNGTFEEIKEDIDLDTKD